GGLPLDLQHHLASAPPDRHLHTGRRGEGAGVGTRLPAPRAGCRPFLASVIAQARIGRRPPAPARVDGGRLAAGSPGCPLGSLAPVVTAPGRPAGVTAPRSTRTSSSAPPPGAR